MVYFLFINSQNNKTGKKRFLFRPSMLSKSERSPPYWLLPPSTNENNYKNIVQQLIRLIFGTKREFNRNNETEYIKSYKWDNKITNIVNPINVNKYPELFLLDSNSKSSVNTMVKKAEIIEGKVLMVNVFYYLEKLNATNIEKVQGYCDYHKTMLISNFDINRKTSVVYDEKLNKFVEIKEPYMSAILRSLMGNTGGGRKHPRYIKKNRRINSTRRINRTKRSKKRNTRRMTKTRKR